MGDRLLGGILLGRAQEYIKRQDDDLQIGGGKKVIQALYYCKLQRNTPIVQVLTHVIRAEGLPICRILQQQSFEAQNLRKNFFRRLAEWYKLEFLYTVFTDD